MKVALVVDTLRALETGLESFFEGNVSDYEAFRRKELGTAADQPHRIRYTRLVA